MEHKPFIIAESTMQHRPRPPRAHLAQELDREPDVQEQVATKLSTPAKRALGLTTNSLSSAPWKHTGRFIQTKGAPS